MIAAIPFLAATLSVACLAVMSRVDPELAATLLIVGVGLGFVSAGFAGVAESQKHRRRDKLGSYIDRALKLKRDLADPGIPFADSKKSCDILENEMDAYVRAQFGPGAVAHLNNSEGISIVGTVYKKSPDGLFDRPKYANWCSYRAARLSTFVDGLS